MLNKTVFTADNIQLEDRYSVVALSTRIFVMNVYDITIRKPFIHVIICDLSGGSLCVKLMLGSFKTHTLTKAVN